MYALLFTLHQLSNVRARMAQWLTALASHQCGPGSIPGLDIICGLSFVVGSCPCSEGFSPGSLVISSLLKNQHFQIPIRSGIRGLQVYQVLCTCHQLAPGVGPRANQGDCKMG